MITKEKAVDELYSAIQKATAAIQPILILQEQPQASVEQGGGRLNRQRRRGHPM
ncbi:MAG TPA: hypothetical protein VFX36_08730 [Nitrospira sp.]|nr:hypothetical protein [Nitrospira sp.]